MICQLHCFPFFGEGSKVSRLLLKSEFSAMKMDLNFTLVSVKNIIRSYWDLYFDFKGRRIKRTSSCNHVMQTLTIKCRFLWNKDFGKRKCFKEIWIENLLQMKWHFWPFALVKFFKMVATKSRTLDFDKCWDSWFEYWNTKISSFNTT